MNATHVIVALIVLVVVLDGLAGARGAGSG